MARILLVDDHDPALIDLAVHLEENGHETSFCAGGRRALADLSARRYDALVVGLVQPDVSGWLLLRRARRTNPSALLFGTYGLSGPVPPADLVRFTESQGARAIMKPIEPRVLAMRITLALARDLEARETRDLPTSA